MPCDNYRGGVACGSEKEAELPVLGDTGSHCHTVTVGTTHSGSMAGPRSSAARCVRRFVTDRRFDRASFVFYCFCTAFVGGHQEK
ncbi:hypothetical protein KQX54_004076 [Cotesia glomerata]|uniref:Uncharacterized protein n=1 Tax=Cotesia glomerata TaxID=32391 RepID=A0AAV7ILT0_COTGL|nr:hypothetical protein KQX54_004076 [Cotesia glomerata]